MKYKNMNKQTLEALNIIEKRAEYKRMSEEVRDELLNMIEEMKDEVVAIIEGADENEQFHQLDESTDIDFPGYDWVDHRLDTRHTTSPEGDLKPKRDLAFFAMDQFKS